MRSEQKAQSVLVKPAVTVCALREHVGEALELGPHVREGAAKRKSIKGEAAGQDKLTAGLV